MDKGELTAMQFKDRMTQMGVEIPPEIMKMLIDHQSSGNAIFNTFAGAFERLLQERETKSYDRQDINGLIALMRSDLQNRDAALALQRLYQAFGVHDETNSKRLPMQDFVGVMMDPGLEGLTSLSPQPK